MAFTLDHHHSVRRDTSQLRQELLQLSFRLTIAGTHGGGCRNEPNPVGAGAERMHDAPQEKRQLCGLRSDIVVCLVQNDPLQLALGLLKDWCVLCPHQHVLQHGGVRDEDWRRVVSEC